MLFPPLSPLSLGGGIKLISLAPSKLSLVISMVTARKTYLSFFLFFLSFNFGDYFYYIFFIFSLFDFNEDFGVQSKPWNLLSLQMEHHLKYPLPFNN